MANKKPDKKPEETPELVKTWGQACDYTFKTRHSWRHGNGRKTVEINTGHFTRLRGRSFPISRITQPCMAQVGIELEEEGLSDSTINRVISAVSTVLNHCAFDGLLESVPKFRRRTEEEHRRKYFTRQQCDQFLAACLDPFERQDLHDLCLVAAYTGMRRGELLSLKARDIDLGTNMIHVGGLPDFQTKAKNYRTIPIHDRIHSVISERIEFADLKDKVFHDWENGDMILRAFRKVHNYCRFEDSLTFHSFRHSFCTWLAEAGQPMLRIKELAGHKRIETTLIYTKITDQGRNEAIASLK